MNKKQTNMKADQTDCDAVMLLEGDDRLSKEMWFDSKFFQRDKCTVFLDFYLMKIVVVTIVREDSKSLKAKSKGRTSETFVNFSSHELLHVRVFVYTGEV